MNKEEFITIPRLDGNFGGLLVSTLVSILSEKEKIILFDSRESHKLALSCAPALKSQNDSDFYFGND